MKISEEYFDRLSPSYKKLIEELEKKLEKCNGDYSKETEILLKFGKNYLMPIEYWHYVTLYDRYCDQHKYDYPYRGDYDDYPLEHNTESSYHFYFDENESYLSDSTDFEFKKTLKFAMAIRLERSQYLPKENAFVYPHSHLIQCFHEIDSKSNQPLPKELISKYETNKKLYNELKAVESNVEKWFNLLKKFGDENDNNKFVRHNVEYRLGSNLLDVKLWNLYFEYLRAHNPKEMLQVYSKYCRFFLDDLEMKEKYKNEVAKYGPVYVPWKNLFDFERGEYDAYRVYESEDEDSVSDGSPPSENPYDSELEDKYDEESESDESLYGDVEWSYKQNTWENFNKIFRQTFLNQIFPFKMAIMTYVLQNAHHFVLRKLHQTCKYFFAEKAVRLCHRLAFPEEAKKRTKFIKESVEISFWDTGELLENVYITTTIDVKDALGKNFSAIISKLYRCDAKYICIKCKLSVTELKYLLQNGNVEVFEWDNVEGFGEEPKIMLEEITQYLPNVQKLELTYAYLDSNTPKAILNQTFLSKIYSLELYQIESKIFDENDFLEFCIKNRAEYFFLNMFFQMRANDRTFVNKLMEKMSNYGKCTKNIKINIC